MSVTIPPFEDPGQHPSQAQLGYGTSLQRGSGTTLDNATDFEDIGEVRDLTPLDMSRDTVDVTNHRSPGWATESIPGLSTPWTATFTMNFVPALFADPTTPQGQLFEDFRSAGNTPWRVVFPTGESVMFLASLTSYSVTAPVTDVMEGSFELSVSGEVRWAISGITPAGTPIAPATAGAGVSGGYFSSDLEAQ